MKLMSLPHRVTEFSLSQQQYLLAPAYQTWVFSCPVLVKVWLWCEIGVVVYIIYCDPLIWLDIRLLLYTRQVYIFIHTVQ